MRINWGRGISVRFAFIKTTFALYMYCLLLRSVPLPQFSQNSLSHISYCAMSRSSIWSMLAAAAESQTWTMSLIWSRGPESRKLILCPAQTCRTLKKLENILETKTMLIHWQDNCIIMKKFSWKSSLVVGWQLGCKFNLGLHNFGAL